MKKRNLKSWPLKLLLLLPVVALVLLAFTPPSAKREDYKNIDSMAYDCAFLSMYPIETYPEEAFPQYFGWTVFKSSYCIPSVSVIEQYMDRIVKSGNPVSTVYLGIRPDKAKLSKLQAFISQYPSISFEIILAYPSVDYWAKLSEREYEQALSDYSDYLLAASDIPNAHFFFPGRLQWLIGNPGNYEDTFLVNEAMAETILLESTILGEHFVVPENQSLFLDQLEALTKQARTTAEAFPDLSDHCLVFFGDSIIGNYTDSTSIPEVVSSFTGSEVYNCGYGGNSAAPSPDGSIFLPGIVEAFVQGDLSVLPEEAQVYQGVSAYLSNYPVPSQGHNLCFIINYGINDYFEGNAISSAQAPMDTATYSGAIRTAVNTLQGAFPHAQIILCTPSYCHYYQDGTAPRGEGNYILTDYVDAVLSLSEELQVDVLDTHHDLGVNSSNWDQYLYQDQVHPNATYRYLIGKSLIQLIR